MHTGHLKGRMRLIYVEFNFSNVEFDISNAHSTNVHLFPHANW